MVTARHRIYLGQNYEQTDSNGSIYSSTHSDDATLAAIKDALAAHEIRGATIKRALGLWEGRYEPSMTIEVVETAVEPVLAAARRLSERLKQTCVLVVSEPVDSRLVTP